MKIAYLSLVIGIVLAAYTMVFGRTASAIHQEQLIFTFDFAWTTSITALLSLAALTYSLVKLLSKYKLKSENERGIESVANQQNKDA